MLRSRQPVAVAAVSLVALAAVVGLAADRPTGPIPAVIELEGGLKISIVDVTFVKTLDAVNAKYETADASKQRGLILTLRVEKAAGESVKIHAPDLALHYTHGSSYDVAPCQGLSGFSTVAQTDRPMSLFSTGFGSTSTGTATAKAEVVYLDAFFQFMEPDTKDLYLLVAQPIGASITCSGY